MYVDNVGLCVFVLDRALGDEAQTKEHIHVHQCDRGLVSRMTRTEVTEPIAA